MDTAEPDWQQILVLRPGPSPSLHTIEPEFTSPLARLRAFLAANPRFAKKALVSASIAAAVTTATGVGFLSATWYHATHPHNSTKKRTLFEAFQVEGRANAEFVERSLGDHDLYT